MAGTEILSKIGVGSGLNTTELIEALVDADSIAQKEALDKSPRIHVMVRPCPMSRPEGVVACLLTCLLFCDPGQLD